MALVMRLRRGGVYGMGSHVGGSAGSVIALETSVGSATDPDALLSLVRLLGHHVLQNDAVLSREGRQRICQAATRRNQAAARRAVQASHG